MPIELEERLPAGFLLTTVEERAGDPVVRVRVNEWMKDTGGYRVVG